MTISGNQLIDILQPGGDEESRAYHFQSQIESILASYTDPFDAFSEILQNSFDAICYKFEKLENNQNYWPFIDILIDCNENRVHVIDNGCGVDPENFHDVLRPNISLKRKLKHRNVRGEKGAAIAFLQFGHDYFLFESLTKKGSCIFELIDGRSWFQNFTKELMNDAPYSEKNFFDANFNQHDNLSKNFKEIDTGSCIVIQFGENCNLKNLSFISGQDIDKALNRWEYILKTRTACGYIKNGNSDDKLPEFIKKMKITIKLIMPNGQQKDKSISIGYLFPHLIGTYKSSSFQSPLKKSALMYLFFDENFISEHMKEIYKKIRYKNLIEKYSIKGYFSYSHDNTYYEEIVEEKCKLTEDEKNNEGLADLINQTIGGFHVGVKQFPNGKRQSFIHRKGAEEKSRAFFVIDFSGDYKPDYGRKTLSVECHDFVRDICKEFIKYSSKFKENFEKSPQNSTRGITCFNDAKTQLNEDSRSLKNIDYFIQSESYKFGRIPMSEIEVIVKFCSLVMQNKLKGYNVKSLASGIYDGWFDYNINIEENQFPKDPLGLQKRPGIKYDRHDVAIEFKKNLDSLIDDFKKNDGDSGKKWFGLLDMCVCEKADDAIDDYILEEISEENIELRIFYGATHILRCNTEASHTIQVICLEKIKD